MFWLGMGIFVVLAVLPVVSATVLNSKDDVKVSDPSSAPSEEN